MRHTKYGINRETEREKTENVKMVDASTTPCQIKAIPLVHMRGKRRSITRKPSMNRNSNVSKISSSSSSRRSKDTNQDVSPVINDIMSSPSTTTLTRSSSMSSVSQDSLVLLSEMEAMHDPVKTLLSDFDKQDYKTTTTTPSQTKEELLSVVPTSIITTQLNEELERRQQVDQVETQSVSTSSKPIEFSLTESNVSRGGVEEKKEETYEESAAAASSSSSEVFVPEWKSKSLRLSLIHI